VKERDIGDDQIWGVKGRRQPDVGHPSDLRYSVGYSDKGHNVPTLCFLGDEVFCISPGSECEVYHPCSSSSLQS